MTQRTLKKVQSARMDENSLLANGERLWVANRAKKAFSRPMQCLTRDYRLGLISPHWICSRRGLFDKVIFYFAGRPKCRILLNWVYVSLESVFSPAVDTEAITMNPKPNLSELARQHGTSRESIRKIRDEGVDLNDPKAVADRVALMRHKQDQPTLTDERRRKLKADADMAELRVAQTKGELISRAEVDLEMRRVGSVFGAALERLQADLPPMLEGLKVESMAGVIREATDNVRRAMVEQYRQMDRVGRAV